MLINYLGYSFRFFLNFGYASQFQVPQLFFILTAAERSGKIFVLDRVIPPLSKLIDPHR